MKLTGFKTLILELLKQIIIGSVILAIEYKTGIFQEISTSKEKSWGRSLIFQVIAVIAIAVASLQSIRFCATLIRVKVLSQHYLREQYSLYAGAFLLWFAFLGLASFISNIMPWDLPKILIFYYRQHAYFTTDTRWTDYGFLCVVYFLVVIYVIAGQRFWTGQVSTEQQKANQTGERPSLFHEFGSTVNRIIKGIPLPSVYRKTTSERQLRVLETVSDSFAWREQARELIELTSLSYNFESGNAWHDSEKCWKGTNTDNDDLVLIYPVYDEVDLSTLEKQAKQYAERILDQNKATPSRQAHIYIAIRKVMSSLKIPAQVIEGNIVVHYVQESILLDRLVNFTDYRYEIKRRVEVNQIAELNLTLKDVYTAPSYFIPVITDKHEAEQTDSRKSTLPTPNSIESRGANIEEHLVNWLRSSEQRHIALLGEYGQGKSTTALMFTYRLLVQEPEVLRIPILIELRGTSPRNMTPLQLLGAWASSYKINPKALLKLLIAGRLLLIFEGFDEMALVGDAEMRLNHFRTLWRFSYPNAKILITGRPNFFFDNHEMKLALGVDEPADSRTPYCQVVRLAPFSAEQIGNALRMMAPEVSRQIVEIARNNATFLDLISRPALLHIVASLWDKENLVGRLDKLTSAYVIGLFLKRSYLRQGQKETDNPEFMALNMREREYFMGGIAAFMAKHELPNQINASELGFAIDRLLDCIPDSISTESPPIRGEVSRPLRERVLSTEFGIEHVKTDVRACGLLVDDLSAAGAFRFGHKSFLEYLIAALVADMLREDKAESTKAISNATGFQIEDIFEHIQSVAFLADLIAPQDRGNLQTGRTKHMLISLLRGLCGHVSGIKWFTLRVQVCVLSIVRAAFLSKKAPISLSWLFKMDRPAGGKNLYPQQLDSTEKTNFDNRTIGILLLTSSLGLLALAASVTIFVKQLRIFLSDPHYINHKALTTISGLLSIFAVGWFWLIAPRADQLRLIKLCCLVAILRGIPAKVLVSVFMPGFSRLYKTEEEARLAVWGICYPLLPQEYLSSIPRDA